MMTEITNLVRVQDVVQYSLDYTNLVILVSYRSIRARVVTTYKGTLAWSRSEFNPFEERKRVLHQSQSTTVIEY